ncbi:MAG TPA: hypothetical protein VFH83_10520, partial [Spirochaetia bacterium]|nr:hypothetical protein [Spirochaetia bacterium]
MTAAREQPYEARPLVVSTGASQAIRVERTLDARRVRLGPSAVVEVLERKSYRVREVVPASIRSAEDGLVSIEFRHTPREPGEYLIHVGADGRRWPAPSALELSFFALPQELASCRPFKGDMHMHTYHSDGIQSPVVMAARCRQVGLDFAAITDHRFYRSSIEAMDRSR